MSVVAWILLVILLYCWLFVAQIPKPRGAGHRWTHYGSREICTGCNILNTDARAYEPCLNPHPKDAEK